MITELGVGVVYVPGLEEFLETESGLNVIEVEPQTFWTTRTGATVPRAYDKLLEWLASLPQAKLIHSVGMPVGGTCAPGANEIGALAKVVRQLHARWSSEHLAFNRAGVGGFDTGFLLPPLQTNQGVDAAVAAITAVARQLPVPFAVETGVNYLRPRPHELPDGEFLARIVERADCGILLDLHNLWANERNGRQSIRDFLASIPLERVWEVHVAGGFEHEGYWIDAHSGLVPPPLVAIVRDVVAMLPCIGALVFEILP